MNALSQSDFDQAPAEKNIIKLEQLVSEEILQKLNLPSDKDVYLLSSDFVPIKYRKNGAKIIVPKGVVVYNGEYLKGRNIQLLFGLVPEKPAICSLILRRNLAYDENKLFCTADLSKCEWFDEENSFKIFNKMMHPTKYFLSFRDVSSGQGEYPLSKL